MISAVALLGPIIIWLLVHPYGVLLQVGPSDTAVIFRFGTPHREAAPGMHLKFPNPVERAKLVKVTIARRFTTSLSDESGRQVELLLIWKVDRATDFLLNSSDHDAVLRRALVGAVHQVANAGDPIEPGMWLAMLRRRLQDALDESNSGIRVMQVAHPRLKLGLSAVKRTPHWTLTRQTIAGLAFAQALRFAAAACQSTRPHAS